MRLLVTGGAGFIGSNFVRYWVEQHPDDHVVAYDVLTYAGNRPNLADVEDRIAFVQGDICDLAPRPSRPSRPRRSTRSSTSPPSPTTPWPCSTRASSSAPTCSGTQTMLEAARQRRGRRVPPHLHLRGLRRPGPRHRRASFTEDCPYRPRTPYNASKAGADHAVRAYGETYGLPVTITNCSQQLRALPVPREGHPAVHHPGPRRPEPDPLRHAPRTAGSGCTCSTTARPSRPCSSGARSARPTTWAAGWRPPSWRSPTWCWRAGQARLAQGDRARPPRPRPPLPARLVQDRAPSSAGRPRSPSRTGLAETVSWYADHRAWWEPLRDRAPVVEAGWGRPAEAPGTGARSWSPGPAGSSAATWWTRWPGGVPRRGPPALRCSAPEGPGAAGSTHEVLADRHRHHARGRPRRRAGRRRGVPPRRRRPRRRPAPRSTPARPIPTGPTPSTPSGTRNVAEAAAAVGAHLLYVSTDYVFDGTSPRPYASGTRPTRSRSTARSKLAGERECPPGSTIVRTSWVCGAHGANMVKTALRLAEGDGHAALRRRPAGLARPSRPTWPRPRHAWARPSAAGHLPRDQPGADHLVRASSGPCWRRPGDDPSGCSPSPRPSSTRPARPPARPTRCSTTRPCA